jgi:hypothetical protein
MKIKIKNIFIKQGSMAERLRYFYYNMLFFLMLAFVIIVFFFFLAVLKFELRCCTTGATPLAFF